MFELLFQVEKNVPPVN